jgi:hypothetical protein
MVLILLSLRFGVLRKMGALCAISRGIRLRAELAALLESHAGGGDLFFKQANHVYIHEPLIGSEDVTGVDLYAAVWPVISRRLNAGP